MNETIKDLTLKKELTLRKAQRADRLNESAKKKLTAFPLWKRLIFFNSFNKLRDKVKKHGNDRFVYTCVTLHLTRLLNRQRRRVSV